MGRGCRYTLLAGLEIVTILCGKARPYFIDIPRRIGCPDFLIRCALTQYFSATQTVLNAFPGWISGKMLNRLTDVCKVLRKEDLTNFRDQTVGMICRLKLGIFQHQD